MEKLNLTQQKHAFTTEKKCTTTQNKHRETKARFSHLLRHPAWKWTEPILVLALHKFVTYLLTYLDTYLQPRDPHGAKYTTTRFNEQNVTIIQTKSKLRK